MVRATRSPTGILKRSGLCRCRTESDGIRWLMLQVRVTYVDNQDSDVVRAASFLGLDNELADSFGRSFGRYQNPSDDLWADDGAKAIRAQ